MPAELIGWGGPLPILAIFLIIFWRKLGTLQKIAFVVIVYAISVLTGILSDVVAKVGNYPSAMIAGIVAPLVYCSIFSVISLSRPAKPEAATQQPTASPAIANQWNPIIVAAIIQAIASIIVALITALSK